MIRYKVVCMWGVAGCKEVSICCYGKLIPRTSRSLLLYNENEINEYS